MLPIVHSECRYRLSQLSPSTPEEDLMVKTSCVQQLIMFVHPSIFITLSLYSRGIFECRGGRFHCRVSNNVAVQPPKHSEASWSVFRYRGPDATHHPSIHGQWGSQVFPESKEATEELSNGRSFSRGRRSPEAVSP